MSAATVKKALQSVPDVKPRVVNPNVACVMLDVSKPYLYDLLKQGAIESYLDGPYRKITVASIDTYIEKNLATAQSSGFQLSPRYLKKQATPRH
jgi:excisionase family DNA binding protein